VSERERRGGVEGNIIGEGILFRIEIITVRGRDACEQVNYFESKALKNASLITATANQQLLRGNINYLEWGQVIHQATLLKNEYLEALKNLNESIIQLNYLTNQ
jgi:cobalt-zinc-cadmium resistance protein CzcA